MGLIAELDRFTEGVRKVFGQRAALSKDKLLTKSGRHLSRLH
jgi:hypothetical protein